MRGIIDKITNPRAGLDWFMLWLFIVIIVILIYCLYVFMYDSPKMTEGDFRSYMSEVTSKNVSKLSQTHANIYALTHDTSKLKDLSSEQLMMMPPKYIPNIADFVEDDIGEK